MLFKDEFDSFDANQPDLLNLYPNFRVRVIACQISPADPMFEYFHASTQALVTRLFAKQPLGRLAVHPTFVFPERWMAPNQINMFMQTLHECPESQQGKIILVDIVTGSPVILTDFTSNMIKVVEAL